MHNVDALTNIDCVIDFGKYLFPNTELINYNDTELLSYIKELLSSALDQPDGYRMHVTSYGIDHAQDIIEQARDILVARGMTFSMEDQAKLSFLSWPQKL